MDAKDFERRWNALAEEVMTGMAEWRVQHPRATFRQIETALDELKTHLRGSKIVLRSKTPDLVRQEFYGLMLAHFAVRGLMHEAALKADEDPDRLSFLHAVRVVRRKIARFASIPPSGQEGIP